MPDPQTVPIVTIHPSTTYDKDRDCRICVYCTRLDAECVADPCLARINEATITRKA
jgi:hypothetical protein